MTAPTRAHPGATFPGRPGRQIDSLPFLRKKFGSLCLEGDDFGGDFIDLRADCGGGRRTLDRDHLRLQFSELAFDLS